MVKTNHDHDGVVMAQEDSKKQVQDLHVYLLPQRVHLPPRFFSRATQRVLRKQQPDVLHGGYYEAGYHVHLWGLSKTNPFEERL